MTEETPANSPFPVRWDLAAEPGPDGKTWLYIDIASTHSRNIHMVPLDFIPKLTEAMQSIHDLHAKPSSSLVIPPMSDAVRDMIKKGGRQ